MQVQLSIKDRDDWIELFNKLIQNGLLTNITLDDIDLEEDQFPVEFFIDIDPILNLVNTNPLVKPFKKKLNMSLTNLVTNVMEG